MEEGKELETLGSLERFRRGQLVSGPLTGSITMEDLLAVLPFGGTFDLVYLTGATLRKVFEFSVRRYGSGTGEFLQVSGTSSLSFPPPPSASNQHCSTVFTHSEVGQSLAASTTSNWGQPTETHPADPH